MNFTLLLLSLMSISLCSASNNFALDVNGSVISNEEKFGDLKRNLKSLDAALEYKPKLENLCGSLLGLIGDYLDNPVASLGSLNHVCRQSFKHENSLKHYVKKRFNIPELENVDQNEPELAGILNLTWCRLDRFFMFLYLMEEIAREKCPYKVIFRNLIAYLARTFKELDVDQREQYKKHLGNKCIISFDVYLSGICAKNGHYDLAFEFLKYHPHSVIFCFAKVGDRTDLFNFFKSNPSFAIKYERNLINYELANIDNNELHYLKTAIHWIGECIIFDIPEESYTELLGLRPRLLIKMIESDWFLSSEIPESEYPRIHAQLKKLVAAFLGPLISTSDFNFSNLINDVRFGLEDSPHLRHFEEVRSFIVSKAALFGNNKDLFLEIVYKYNPYEFSSNYRRYKIISEVVKTLYTEDFHLHKSKFKVIFEFIADHTEHFSTNYYLYFIMRFYAVNQMRIEGDKLILNFVALDDLLSLGYPPVISTTMEDQSNAKWFIDIVFSYMEVVNEETLVSFLNDYMTSTLFKRSNAASFELIELVSRSPRLLEILTNAEMKFWFHPKTEKLEKYLDLPNFEEIAHVIEKFHIFPKDLIELKTSAHLRKLELVQKKSVAEYFLAYKSSLMNNERLLNEIDYFDWRASFSYWIKSDDKERIREIESLGIIKMLKIEYPIEMKRLLDPEFEA